MMRTICVAMVAAGCVLGGCRSSKSVAADDAAVQTVGAQATAVNQTCTYSNKPVNSAYNVNYKGQTLGFCSKGTHDKFVASSEAERDAQLAKALAQSN